MTTIDERLESDLERLREALRIFRVYAALHGNSPDASIIQFAHRGGQRKPQASTVREAWVDYVQGRRYANLETTPYMIENDGGSKRGNAGGARPKRGAVKNRTAANPPSPRKPPAGDDEDILF